MATKKSSIPKIETIEKDIAGLLQPLADGLKVAVGELWGIFVRQFVVKGISELFTAVVLCTGAYYLQPHIEYLALIPVVLAVVLVYDAINLLGNPKYYALNDITKKVQKLKDV